MNYYKYDIVFQEVPGEISLAFYMTGCPLRCAGCHSTALWNAKNGQPLSTELLEKLLTQYEGYISCVLFMGGEWEAHELQTFLDLLENRNITRALYTGRELHELPPELVRRLDILKTGPWRPELGGLDSPHTNQKLHYLKEKLCS